MAVGTERGCGGGLRSGAGAAASLYAGGRGSELLWCVCFGAGGALGACSVRAASVREGGRRARRLGSAEERGSSPHCRPMWGSLCLSSSSRDESA